MFGPTDLVVKASPEEMQSYGLVTPCSVTPLPIEEAQQRLAAGGSDGAGANRANPPA